jgi:SAM-dependent methyltransferase
MRSLKASFIVVTLLAATVAVAQEFTPVVGQPGKDVVWVPTPDELVEKMMDLAQVRPSDFVIDLGSGDGRNVIAAAKRGARGLGVEFNKDMVALSRRLAAMQGVEGRANFVEGDMYKADISKASVMALFLLPSNMLQLRSKFLELKPGSRIVSNTFGMEGWQPDEVDRIPGECESWCSALLWYVPAKVDGAWRLGNGQLTLKQEYQMFSGTLTKGTETLPIEMGRLRGTAISFTAGGVSYSGTVDENSMKGTIQAGGSGKWSASRVRR